jgi:uncharacterized coiled-coil protein SlyX
MELAEKAKQDATIGGLPQQVERHMGLTERLHAAVNTLESRLESITPPTAMEQDVSGVLAEVGPGTAPLTGSLRSSNDELSSVIDRIQAIAAHIDL